MQRLPKELPALLHLVGGHEMQAGVIRVLRVRLGEPRCQLGEDRIVGPCFARWTGLRELGQPQFQALVAWVAAQQSVQCRGAGAGQAGDEDRRGDRHLGVLRVLLP